MNFIVAPSRWSPEIAALLDRSVCVKFGGAIPGLRALIESQGATLLQVQTEAGELIGAAVLRVDVCEDGTREGVIHHVAGRVGPRAVAALLAEFERRFVGVDRIRAHTSRRSVLKFLAHRGYGFQEWVLSKAV